ncbi:hypothetical protein ZYGR_0AG00230 [Zygosaccharomyces rouxii]|uniref:GIT Spa2 homology (SHD) domain-containing protein n=1 Tax=Zygosaccharomyces rouxii TaxID=4956 RepID=A0A1Q3A8K6_ZYGRO|nr:hypothetical protein ZYGR_0AG00230 [Zygosaccharomyces rouxii]
MMDSGTEVSTIHHREIHGYYLALQKYFNNAETKHDRSNSPRAQKARAKLLKLSASQFYELSTDVYDELQRRISDDKSQPEYLLPKATFHMKRNQARQKLANLSHTRFNDLVDDILFEINRRGYNTPPDPEIDENTSAKSIAAAGSSTPNSKRANASHFRTDPNTSIGSDTSNSQIPPTATIQTSKVIPQKASIDWSSDEEQDMKKNDKNTDTNNVNPTTPNKTNQNQESRDLGSNEAARPSNLGALQQPNTTPVLNYTDTYHHYGDVMDSPALTDVGHSQRGDDNLTVDPPKNRHSSTFDFEGVSKNESGETRSVQSSGEAQNKTQLDQLHNEIEVLKKENATLRGSKNFEENTSNKNFENELNSLRAEARSLSMENGQLKTKISELQSKGRNLQPKNKSSSSLSSATDQNELEKLALDRESVTRYAAQDGSIPFESVQEFHQYIQKLFTDLQTDVDDIGHTLFEDLALLSHSVAQLFILVDVPDYKEEVILLKASLSHTITSIRYFAVYGALLPRITVQAAVSELAFAFCNLVRSCKIKGDGRGGAALGRSKIGLNDEKSTIDPQTPNDHDALNSKFKSSFDHPTVITKFDDDFGQDEMSPVKPLNITQKANMSPSAKTPSSTRKQSNGFPFGPMVDTRSPASRGKGSSAGVSFEKTRKLNEASPTTSHSGSIDTRSLAARVNDSSHNKDASKRNVGLFGNSHDKNDSNKTLNDNTTPEKSTTTSRATTAEGTTTLSTPLSTASPSGNDHGKLEESPLKGTEAKPQGNGELSIEGNKIQSVEDSVKPGGISNMRDNNQNATDPMNSENTPDRPSGPYRTNDSTTHRDLPDMNNDVSDINDSIKPEGIFKMGDSEDNANKDPVKDEDSYRSIDPFHNEKEETKEKQGSLSSFGQNPQEPFNIKDSENTRTPQFPSEDIKTRSPEETKKTPEAIKDAISKLEGNSTQDSQGKPEDETPKGPVKSNPKQEGAESKTTRQESEPMEEEQEGKSKKNSGKSLADKLRTFATNAGIGLRADKEQKDKQAAASQIRSRNSSGDSSDDRRKGITINDDEKSANLSGKGSSVPRRPSLNQSSDNNSKADSPATAKTTELEPFDTENERLTPLETSSERNKGGSDGSNPNSNGSQLRKEKPDSFPQINVHEENGESGTTPALAGPAFSHDETNMKINGGSKNESFGQSVPGISKSGNGTPSVTLNDGNKEMDITPRDGSRSLENRSISQDKEVPSKLPNFYFSNIPQPPTNSNLTDKLKKTFADIPSEDEYEEGSDFNNSPYLSDDGSVFRAFKQSLREENGANRGSPLIQQQNFHNSNSEARELPAGLGLSEKTDLKLNKDPIGFSSGLDHSSKSDVPEQIMSRGHSQDKESESTPYEASSQSHPKEEFSRKEQDGAAPHKEEDSDISHSSRSNQRNESDLPGFGDVDDPMKNSKYHKQHDKVGADRDESSSALSKNAVISQHESPLRNKVKNDGYKDAYRRWESTDEEDDYDTDSFKDAFTENKPDRSRQNSDNSKSHAEQRDINNLNGMGNRINDDSRSKRDSSSFADKNFHKDNRRHDASDSPVFPGSVKGTNQEKPTSIDEPTDDLNAEPSFAEDKDIENASAPNSDRAAVPQLQPVKLISSNSQSHDSSNDKAESSKNEDVTKSPNVPKTPVMKNSASRPQAVKTPSGKTPSLGSPALRSPGTRSLASNRTDDGDYTFDVDAFDIENPDNTLSELLLYLEHQSLQVIATIQSLLTSIKEPHATRGNLRKESNAISQVIRQMVDATSVSMNQSRNASLKEHGSWVVKSLEDCYLRMTTLCQLNRTGEFGENSEDANYANKHFKQRLAGIAFDIAKCTKELVKTVEEASLKEEIEFLNSRLN